MDDLGKWLADNDLQALAAPFAENDITADILSDLSDDDLREIGLSLGLRKRFRKAFGANSADARQPVEITAVVPRSNYPGATAERRNITVMFVDLVGSTQLSRQMDPEKMGSLLRSYQNCVSGEIARYNGHVAKFMGDGVLAYFGWPRAHEDDVEQAVRSGLALITAVGQLTGPGGVPLRTRIGIATGLVVVGDLIGDEEARERTVTGETPNLAARLQGVANPDTLLISEATAKLVDGLFDLAPVDDARLKGFDIDEPAIEVTGEKDQESRFEARNRQMTTPIVGRNQELALLMERWAQATAAEGQGMLIIGEAGIGKSRILRAMLDEIAEQDHFRVRYQCSPNFQDVALWPIVQHLNRVYDFAGLETAEARAGMLSGAMGKAARRDPKVAALFAELMGVDIGQGEQITELTALQKRQQTLEALIGQLLQLCAIKPVLFVVEDSQWADPTTLEFMELALDAIAGARCLILFTSRPENLPHLDAHRQISQLNLSRLGRDAGYEIIRGIAGNLAVSDEIADNILERTDGIPLFVEELTKSLKEDGLLARQGSENGAAGRSNHDPAIPLTLHDSLMARLDHLHDVKIIAQTASCIGREFDHGLLQAITNTEAGPLVAALDRLVEAELIFCRGKPPEATYIFKHALVRDAAYESLLISHRQRVHGDIAEILASSVPPAQPELIARHAELAGETEKAIEYCLIAGAQASRRYANAEAVRAYFNALRGIEAQPPDRGRDEQEIDCRLALGLPLIALKGYASRDVEENYRLARTLCGEAGRDAQLFVSTRGLWNCIYDRGEVSDSLVLAEHLVDLADKDGAAGLKALAKRALGSSYMSLGRFIEANEAFDECIEISTGAPIDFTLEEHGEIPQIIASQYLGYLGCVTGRLDYGLQCCDSAVKLARETNHLIVIAFSLSLYGTICLFRRDYDACRIAEEEVGRLSAEHGFVFWSAHSECLLGSALAHLGDHDKGVKMGVKGIENWRRTDALLHVPTWSSFLADAALAAGHLEAAQQAVSDGLAMTKANQDVFALAELQRLDGAIAAKSGDDTGALTRLDAAIATAQGQGAWLYNLRAQTDRAELLARQGDGPAARAGLEQAMEKIVEHRSGLDYQRAEEILGGL